MNSFSHKYGVLEHESSLCITGGSGTVFQNILIGNIIQLNICIQFIYFFINFTKNISFVNLIKNNLNQFKKLH
jgi:hypothetical protein